MQFLVSTTGFDVDVEDLGITVTHPTTDRDLNLEFSTEEIQESVDLDTLISGGSLTLRLETVEYGVVSVDGYEYRSTLLLEQTIKDEFQEGIVSEDELISTSLDREIVDSQFPIAVSSTTAITNVVISTVGRFHDWKAAPGDKLVIVGGAAAGTYTIQSITNQTTFVTEEDLVTTNNIGTMIIYHPPGAMRVGIDTTSTSQSKQSTLQNFLEDIDGYVENSVLLDGSRTMTGSLDLGGFDLLNANNIVDKLTLDGYVAGPSSANDNEVARYDGYSGTIIQGSSVYLDDSKNLGNLNQTTMRRLTLDRSGSSNELELFFDGATWTLQQNDGAGALWFMKNANFPQLLAGDPAMTGSFFIDADNNQAIALNTLNPGPVSISDSGLLPETDGFTNIGQMDDMFGRVFANLGDFDQQLIVAPNNTVGSIIGSGNGGTTDGIGDTHSATISTAIGNGIVPGTLRVTVQGRPWIDDGNGVLIANTAFITNGTVNYSTGAIVLNWTAASEPASASVDCNYLYYIEDVEMCPLVVDNGNGKDGTVSSMGYRLGADAIIDGYGNIDTSAGSLNGTINGHRHYAASSTDPVTPAPTEGDRYYNTTLEMEMRYDGSRSKWLSTESAMFSVGRNNNTAAGNFYRSVNGLVMSSTIGYPALFNGTVVGFGYTRDDTDSATFEVVANGTNVATLASSALAGKSNSLNGDFDEDDILAVRNASGGNTTSDVAAWVKVKWRA